MLKNKFPCCGGAARIHTDTDIEFYERTCPRCGKEWIIKRRIVSSQTRELVNADVEILDWERAPKPQTLF